VINSYVNHVEVYENHFVWHLNGFDDKMNIEVRGRKNNPTISLVESENIPANVHSSTGSH